MYNFCSIYCNWYQTSLYPSQTITRLQRLIECPRRFKLARTRSMSSHEGFDITGLVTTMIVSSRLRSSWFVLCFVRVRESSKSLADFVLFRIFGVEYKFSHKICDSVVSVGADVDAASAITSAESPEEGSFGACVDAAASMHASDRCQSVLARLSNGCFTFR